MRLIRLAFLSCLLPLLHAGAFSASLRAAPPTVDSPDVRFFEQHIRPLLVESCLDCHSSETESSGNLTLDSKAAWEAGGTLGPTIVPGDPDASLLVRALEYDDPELQMPPDGKLPAETIQKVRRWIAEGAVDPRQAAGTNTKAGPTALPVERAGEHWAYQPLGEPRPPFAATAIDGFIDRSLNAAGLEPVETARPAALLRRLTYDLTGLPPTPEALDRFAADPSPWAWQREVDRLLTSPAFAEHFARHWLDVARYAESITLRGFVLPEAWRFRDYVIEAYARDEGFDEMVRNMIAGDLRGSDDVHQRQRQHVATSFLAMGNHNLEDQDKTKLEFDYIDEQLQTIGRAFLGQTIGCARCHDHKFDPIPTADYYALAAVFRSTRALDHANVSKWIEKPLPIEPSEQQRFREIEQRLASVKKELGELQGKASAPAGQIAIDSLPGIVIDDADAQLVGDWKPSTFYNGFVGSGYRHDEGGKETKTATFEPPEIGTGQYEVRFAYTPGGNRAKAAKVTVFSANEAKTIHVDQRKKPPLDGAWMSLGTYPFEKDGQAFVMVSNQDAGGVVIIDAVQFLPIEDGDPKRADARENPQDQARAADQEQKRQAQIKQLKAEQRRLEADLAERPRYLAVLEAEPVEQLAIRLRGLPHEAGPPVQRGFLTAVGRADHWKQQIGDDQSGRLALANWIADRRNPLTARVYANRVWGWLMGEGLVRRENEFGTTGEPPTHPELLEYLAGQLIKHDYSTKQLVRLIVNTRVYQRRQGRVHDPAVKLDPDNRLYWSAHPRRLSVEALRDTMLVISGELDRQMFGSTIRPGTKADYNYAHRSTRRSLYSPVFRNSLPPLFGVFDFADSSISVGQRAESTVATQSLALMNSDWVQQRARAAAKRWLGNGQRDTTPAGVEDLEALFRQAVGRAPTPRERELCQSMIARPAEQAVLLQALFASIDFRYLE